MKLDHRFAEVPFLRRPRLELPRTEQALGSYKILRV